MFNRYAVKDFMGKPAPAGYVAGLGRGATGFTTRPDIGPARDGPLQMEPSNEQEQGRFEDDVGEEQFDENEAGLLGRGRAGAYDAEDEEADLIYASIDAKMEERRRSRREEQEQAQLKKLQDERPKTQLLFADLKRDLTRVSAAEWEALPEVGDFRAKRMKKVNEKERFVPLPDSVISGTGSSGYVGQEVTEQEEGEGNSGVNGEEEADFVKIGETRGKLLGMRLDQIQKGSEKETGTFTSEDKETGDLLTMVKSETELGDIKKARMLLKSLITSNPKNPSGWISAARLEQVAGNLKQARALIARGYEECPKSEDVWMEAVKLNISGSYREILASALRNVPNSVKLWLYAVEIEEDSTKKKKILRSAIEQNPSSEQLWMNLVELEEDSNDARILLSSAVECVPEGVDLWLALARLESHENARKVLNKARQACPKSLVIWINAARLEEANNNQQLVSTILTRAITDLATKGVILERSKWFTEAENCEAGGDLVTAAELIKLTWKLDEPGEGKTLIEEILEYVESSEYPVCARTAVKCLTREDPKNVHLWLKAIELESGENVDNLFKEALSSCPDSEELWLAFIREKAEKQGDLRTARAILTEAFKLLAGSEKIWLTAVDLELKAGDEEAARQVLQKGRQENPTMVRLWIKAVEIERLLQSPNVENLCREGLVHFPKEDRLWLALGRIAEIKSIEAARQVYMEAMKACKSVDLILTAARIESDAVRTRVLLEKGRQQFPKNGDIWAASIDLEMSQKQPVMAKNLLAKALKECPLSGRVWWQAIFMEPRPLRKSRALDALTKLTAAKSTDRALIHLALAKIFESERKIDTVREHFENAVREDPSNADVWRDYYRFEESLMSTDDKLWSRIVTAGPNSGDQWRKFIDSINPYKRDFEDLFREFLTL